MDGRMKPAGHFLDIAWGLHKESLINRVRLALGDDARVRAWIAEQNKAFERAIDVTNGFDVGAWAAEDLEGLDCFIHDRDLLLRGVADAQRHGGACSCEQSEVLKYVNVARACIYAIDRCIQDDLETLVELSLPEGDKRAVELGRSVRRVTDDMIDRAVSAIRQEYGENS